jgi:hypothetical protein
VECLKAAQGTKDHAYLPRFVLLRSQPEHGLIPMVSITGTPSSPSVGRGQMQRDGVEGQLRPRLSVQRTNKLR